MYYSANKQTIEIESKSHFPRFLGTLGLPNASKATKAKHSKCMEVQQHILRNKSMLTLGTSSLKIQQSFDNAYPGFLKSKYQPLC